MDIFYEDPFVFLLLTVILGGGAAFMAGRALAKGWKSPALLFVYMLLFACGVRFLHFALFEQALFSAHYYLVDMIVIQALAFLGYRTTLARQMVEKYPFAYESTGPFSWRDKPKS